MAFQIIDGLVKRGGETIESIKFERVFDKTREGWIASVFLLRKMLIEGRLWYVRKNDIQASEADIYARPIEFIKGKPYSDNVLPIQVFRIVQQSPILINAIKKKLADDLKGVSLVGYIMRDERIDWNILATEFVQLKPNVKDITLIGSVSERKFIVGQVFPEVVISMVNLDLFTINGPPMIEPTQVFKTEEAGVTKIGEAILTPTFDVKRI